MQRATNDSHRRDPANSPSSVVPPEQLGQRNPLSELKTPSAWKEKSSAAITIQLANRTEERSALARSESTGAQSGLRLFFSRVAQHPEKIVDAVAATISSIAAVSVANVSGGGLTLSGLGLGLGAAAVGLASYIYVERKSPNGEISLTSSLKNWGQSFMFKLQGFKEALDCDGLKVCLGAVVMGACAAMPTSLLGITGTALGALRVVSSHTFVAGLRCGLSMLGLPLAAIATLYQGIAKPVHELARWASRENSCQS
jgi:hypothetical protein